MEIRRLCGNDDTIINNYNSERDEAFRKAFRGEIGMREYKEEAKQIDRKYASIFTNH